MMPEVERTYKEMADKYNFNYYDYNESMDILERARRV
jgi:hypothetical protein